MPASSSYTLGEGLLLAHMVPFAFPPSGRQALLQSAWRGKAEQQMEFSPLDPGPGTLVQLHDFHWRLWLRKCKAGP